MKLKVSLFILLAVASTGCVDIPDFSDTPKIYYNGISQETRMDTVNTIPQEAEVLTVTIDFEDGDGDLGATPQEYNNEDFTAGYEKTQGWGLAANYELITMIKQKDSTWSETIMPADSFKWFPLLKVDGKAGPIKGKLDMNARFRKLNSAVPTKLKFKVRVIDRAHRISNQIETDEVSVRLWPL